MENGCYVTFTRNHEVERLKETSIEIACNVTNANLSIPAESGSSPVTIGPASGNEGLLLSMNILVNKKPDQESTHMRNFMTKIVFFSQRHYREKIYLFVC